MGNLTNKFIVLAYENDSPEFISFGIYDHKLEADNVLGSLCKFKPQYHFIVAEILKEVSNA